MRPKCTTYSNGSKEWRLNGKLHREDGLPAVECVDGRYKEWFLNGKRHREDGPAAEWVNGYKTWFLNGKKYLEEEYYNELYRRGKITIEEAFIHLICL